MKFVGAMLIGALIAVGALQGRAPAGEPGQSTAEEISDRGSVAALYESSNMLADGLEGESESGADASSGAVESHATQVASATADERAEAIAAEAESRRPSALVRPLQTVADGTSVASDFVAAAGLVAAIEAARGNDPGESVAPQSQAMIAVPDEGVALPPLTAEDPFLHLPVEGFGAAVVWLPLGTTTPRPVIVATHGNYDRPEWVCERWAYIAPEAFVVCPRGMPRSTDRGDTQRYHHRSRRYLNEELDALLPILEERFGDRIAEGPMLYTGFSQGAIFGRRHMVRQPELFPRAVLASGGDEWDRGDARHFAEGGGQRVLFVCGQAGCNRNATRAVEYLREEGVEAEVIYHQGAGHTYDMDMVEDTIARLDWLFEGDSRWSASERSRHWVRADLVDE